MCNIANVLMPIDHHWDHHDQVIQDELFHDCHSVELFDRVDVFCHIDWILTLLDFF
jgi:hypothetical protein